MGKKINFCAAALLVAACAATARADLTTIAAQLGATLNPGTAPTGIFGNVVGGDESSGYQLTPYAAPYDYFMPSPMGSSAGNLRDFHWVQESSGAFLPPTAGTYWSFGGLRATDFIVDPSIDHDPIPDEGLEHTLYGSADGGATWIPGTLTEVYAQGWDPASIEDEPSSRWSFTSPVSLISLTAGLAQGNYFNNSDDTEIDAVSIMPEPATALMLVLTSTWLLRRRR